MASKKKAAQIEGPSAYPVIASDDMAKSLAAIRENLGEGSLGAFDLDRVRVPAGGGRTFEIDGLEGVEAKPVIPGIIIAWRQTRCYWRGPKGTTTTPPDCTSSDGMIGVGDPGGKCRDCPFSEFGTAVKEDGAPGAGQACKDGRQLFVLQEASWLPTLIVAPPTSIKAVKTFMTRLASKAVPFYAVYVKIGIEVDTSAGGDKFSKLTISSNGLLEPEALARVREYQQCVQPMIAGVPVTPSDGGEPGDGTRPDDDDAE